ncbi:sulfatase [Natronomonas sp.]|uniref:sulfatase n=1 Tax=Natronomonas sp. TaxID=2184060 RepID=UPI0039747C19
MPDSTNPGRNIVFVTVDSLRADRCGFMGYDEPTTPTLDEMAADGVAVEHAIAPGPITPASLPAMFTGKYPLAIDDDSTGGTPELTAARGQIRKHMETQDSLPAMLSRQGYATAGFTPNPWTSRYFGFDAGFDHFEDYMSEDVSSTVFERMLSGEGSKGASALRLVLSWMQRENVFKPWEAFYDDVVEWIERAPEPYFVWVFLLDVHFPYLPTDAYRSQSRWRGYEANLRLYLEEQRDYDDRVHEQLSTAYDDAVRYTDRFFARLQADLDDPLVVVTGDHGEAFGEHGTYTHQDQLYEENIRVPLVIGGGPSGHLDGPVSLRSIPRLLTELAATGEVADVGRPFAIARSKSGDSLAARGRRAKYIHGDDRQELYDLRRGEQAPIRNDDLAALCRAVVDQARESGVELARLTEAAGEVGGI